jgi:hypothetical protein
MDTAYAADDRTRDEAGTPDGLPDLDALRNLWTARDERYAARSANLSSEAVAAVRSYRISETRDLPVQQRAAGYREAVSWTPPVIVR